MTYNVFGGTLNPTLLYYDIKLSPSLIPFKCCLKTPFCIATSAAHLADFCTPYKLLYYIIIIIILLYCIYFRAAQLQALQPPTNYYQQTPLQQTGFYQAQQTGSTLQVPIRCYQYCELTVLTPISPAVFTAHDMQTYADGALPNQPSVNVAIRIE